MALFAGAVGRDFAFEGGAQRRQVESMLSIGFVERMVRMNVGGRPRRMTSASRQGPRAGLLRRRGESCPVRGPTRAAALWPRLRSRCGAECAANLEFAADADLAGDAPDRLTRGAAADDVPPFLES